MQPKSVNEENFAAACWHRHCEHVSILTLAFSLNLKHSLAIMITAGEVVSAKTQPHKAANLAAPATYITPHVPWSDMWTPTSMAADAYKTTGTF